MAKNKEIFFTKEGRIGSANSSTAGTGALIFNAGVDGSKLLMLTAASKSGSPNGVSLWIDGVEIAELFTGIPNIGDNLMTNLAFPVDKNGNAYVNLPAGAAVHVRNGGSGSVKVGFYAEDY